MNYGSVCSGIEAASVAWHPLGWKASFLSEIEPFPRVVLAHHYPYTPLHGDFTTIQKGDYDPIQLLVGGTPCQSFSVAGLRAGLDDPRGNLMLEFGALAKRLQPEWICWENVPGVLSSNRGRDFGTFLGMLGELGFGFAYRILDAQYAGVPQRRRRVFVVGHLGDWRLAAAVLFERHSLSGHPAPSRKAGQEVAGTIAKCSFSGGAGGRPEGAAGNHFQVANCLRAKSNDPHRADTGNCVVDSICMSTGQAGAEIGIGIGATLNCNHEAPIACNPIDTQNMTEGHNSGGLGFGQHSDPSFTITKGHSHAGAFEPGFLKREGTHFYENHTGTLRKEPGDNQMSVAANMQVRRLTPTECERLQGFPDGYTNVPYRNKPAADGPRYKALGNSMAVPVMAWIGERIEMVNRLKLEVAEC